MRGKDQNSGGKKNNEEHTLRMLYSKPEFNGIPLNLKNKLRTYMPY